MLDQLLKSGLSMLDYTGASPGTSSTGLAKLGPSAGAASADQRSSTAAGGIGRDSIARLHPVDGGRTTTACGAQGRAGIPGGCKVIVASNFVPG